MVHLAAVPETITAADSARVFLDNVFRLHGMPTEIISDRDPRFVAAFWQGVFRLLGTQLKMSTADHPETDGQTERTNRTLEEILRAYAHSFESWSGHLSMAEFAINNSVHASTGHTPFYTNGLRHPRLPALLGIQQHHSTKASSAGTGAHDLNTMLRSSGTEPDTNVSRTPSMRHPVAARVAASVHDFTQQREAVVRFIQDSIADASDRQKANADMLGRTNMLSFNEGEEVLLSTSNLAPDLVSGEGSKKLLPKYIGPFRIVRRNGMAYTLDMPSALRVHPTFYVGRLRPYRRRYGRASTQTIPTALPRVGFENVSSNPGQHPQPCIETQGHGAVDPLSPGVSPGAPPFSPTDQSVDPDVAVVQPVARGSFELVVPAEADSAAPGTAPGSRSREQPLAVFPPPPPPLRGPDGAQRWLVDYLVDHRDQPATRHREMNRLYRVRWLGLPPSHDTWEHRTMLLEDMPDEVRAYESEHPLL
jgi:hypothetical protein